MEIKQTEPIQTACLDSIVITSQGGILICRKGNFFPQIFLYRLFTNLVFQFY